MKFPIWYGFLRRKRRLIPCIFTDYWGCGKFVLYNNYDLHKHEYSQTTILLQRRSVRECVVQWIHNRHSPQMVMQSFGYASEFVHILHSSWLFCKTTMALNDMVKTLKGANTLCRYLTVAATKRTLYRNNPMQLSHLFMFVIDTGVAELRNYDIGETLRCKVIRKVLIFLIPLSTHDGWWLMTAHLFSEQKKIGFHIVLLVISNQGIHFMYDPPSPARRSRGMLKSA